MKFKLIENFDNYLTEQKLDEATIRGETSLRQFLCSLLSLACHCTLIDADYVIHHKDGNHFNNNYDNIILLPKLSGSNPNTTLHNLYRAGKIDFSSTNPILYNRYLDQLEIMKGIDVFISLSAHRLLNSKGKII